MRLSIQLPGHQAHSRYEIVRPLVLLVSSIVWASLMMPAGAQEVATATRGFHQVRGSSLYVQTFGAGRPVLFLHGGGVYFDNNFASQRDYFASFRKVIGLDQRGHGHSPDDGRPFSYREMAEDTAALIRQLDIGPVDVVGHSDGGNVGLILARYHPQLVRRLVVSGANIRAGLPLDELERRKKWSAQQVDEKVLKLSESLPPNFRADYESVTPNGREHWWTFLTKSYQLWLTPTVLEAAELKAIGCPVLVMAGDRDFTPIEETLEIYRGLPRGQLFILPGTGHGTMKERPELVNLAIREFLERADNRLPAR